MTPGKDVRRPLLWRAQRACCALCGGRLRKHGTTEEHVIPLALTGRSRSSGNKWNALLTHRLCNMAKGDSPPTDNDYMTLSAINIVLHAEGYA